MGMKVMKKSEQTIRSGVIRFGFVGDVEEVEREGREIEIAGIGIGLNRGKEVRGDDTGGGNMSSDGEGGLMNKEENGDNALFGLRDFV